MTTVLPEWMHLRVGHAGPARLVPDGRPVVYFPRGLRVARVPIVESGEALLCALASVTWPTIFALRGTVIRPCASRSVAVRASTRSLALAFLAFSDFDSSTESSVPDAGASAEVEALVAEAGELAVAGSVET